MQIYLSTSCVHFRPYLFRPQSKDIQDCGGYQTVGVDMVVTGERIILLDTQVSVHNPSVCVHMCVCVCVVCVYLYVCGCI